MSTSPDSPLLSINGAEVAYEDRGDRSAPAVVLLHGTLMDRTMFASQLEALSGTHRVVAYDHRGRSAAGAKTPFTLNDLVDDLRALLDELGIGRAVIGGMSMGGFTALRFAVRHPGRVAALLLIATAAAPHPPEAVARLQGMLAFSKTYGMTPLLGPVAEELFGATTRQKQPELVRAWQDRWTKMDLDGVTNEVNSWLHREDFTPRLAEIEVPALVVHGAEDTSLHPDLARAMAHGLKRGRFVEIPAAGHSANLEQPAAVNRAIGEFLSAP